MPTEVRNEELRSFPKPTDTGSKILNGAIDYVPGSNMLGFIPGPVGIAPGLGLTALSKLYRDSKREGASTSIEDLSRQDYRDNNALTKNLIDLTSLTAGGLLGAQTLGNIKNYEPVNKRIDKELYKNLNDIGLVDKLRDQLNPNQAKSYEQKNKTFFNILKPFSNSNGDEAFNQLMNKLDKDKNLYFHPDEIDKIKNLVSGGEDNFLAKAMKRTADGLNAIVPNVRHNSLGRVAKPLALLGSLGVANYGIRHLLNQNQNLAEQGIKDANRPLFDIIKSRLFGGN